MEEELDFDDDPETVMRESRARFVEAFSGRVRSMTQLGAAMTAPGDLTDAIQATVRRMAHQMAGIAGTLGFSGVGRAAADLERLVAAPGLVIPGAGLSAALLALRESFSLDSRQPAPAWAVAPEVATGVRVLIWAAEEAERERIGRWLREAGHRVSFVRDAADAYPRARVDRPALVVLDLDASASDVHAVCRRIKGSPDLAGTRIVLMTADTSATDRRFSAALGADGCLLKPVERSTLVGGFAKWLGEPTPAPSDGLTGMLTYEAFAFAAAEMLRRSTTALALWRLPHGREQEAAAAITDEGRSPDLAGQFDARHAVSLLCGPGAEAATFGVAQISRRCPGLRAGVSASGAPGTTSLEAMLAEADQRLLMGDGQVETES